MRVRIHASGPGRLPPCPAGSALTGRRTSHVRTRPRPTRTATAAIAVDAMGGDHAPDEIVAGAVAAARDGTRSC